MQTPKSLDLSSLRPLTPLSRNSRNPLNFSSPLGTPISWNSVPPLDDDTSKAVSEEANGDSNNLKNGFPQDAISILAPLPLQRSIIAKRKKHVYRRERLLEFPQLSAMSKETSPAETHFYSKKELKALSKKVTSL